jgi:hypothetical protein
MVPRCMVPGVQFAQGAAVCGAQLGIGQRLIVAIPVPCRTARRLVPRMNLCPESLYCTNMQGTVMQNHMCRAAV